MPIVEREVMHDVASMHTRVKGVERKYVHPTRLKPDDKVVKPERMSKRQLADYAFLYPEEYGPIAAARKIEPARPRPRDLDATKAEVDESIPLVPGVSGTAPVASGVSVEAIQSYLALSASDALAVVKNLGDEPGDLDALQAFYAIEQSGKARSSLLKAMEKRLGITESSDDDSGGDQGGGAQ